MNDLLSDLLKAYQKAEKYRSENGTNRYPEDFKSKVVEIHNEGMAVYEIKKATGINANTLYSWIQNQPQDEKTIPVEWIRPPSEEKASIILSSGIRIELPTKVLTEKLLAWILKAS